MPAFDVDQLCDGVRAGNRAALGRAVTLIESHSPKHQANARALLERLMPYTGAAHRVGLSGVPGVGKSTFIESLGLQLIEKGHKVAVLAVDPSSSRTGGSILGDKTRMERLSQSDDAFIRPSPSAGVLGGVARATQETILIFEAAGYDVVLVETVGTGQSETMVADMVDLFLVLMLPGAGDDLQGIKKGIIERADILAVNKADAFPNKLAMAVRDYKAALHILSDADANWHPPVLPVSGLTGEGLVDLWDMVEKHQRIMERSGSLQSRRETQQVSWLHRMLGERLLSDFKAREAVREELGRQEAAVKAGTLTPFRAVDDLIALAFRR